MVSTDTLRKAALSFGQVTELPHFDKTSFRVNRKIFCTLDSNNNKVSIKLTEIEQSIYCKIDPSLIVPATGAWGKQGWTIFDFLKIKKNVVLEAMKKGYFNVANKPSTTVAKKNMNPEKIQTLHPDKTKTNKKIELAKYNLIRENILSILKKRALTHTDLMEHLYSNVKDTFVGGVQWYGETVKLDLEARKIIERTSTKPEKYRLRATNR